MEAPAYEVNFDGLIGPTHNYSGLSYGNVASLANKESTSSPKQAALQGLEKMKLLAGLGLKQAILPPHERPHIPTLKALGFEGSDEEISMQVYKKYPDLFFSCSSAASMWTANAATVAPSSDTRDQRVHFTPANLSTNFHRSIEPDFTSKILQAIFKEASYFVHHPCLPKGTFFSDEGAANHTRLCSKYHQVGIHLFTYGRYGLKTNPIAPKIYPARQTLEASQALSRLHLLDPEKVVFTQQNPQAIDCGVFHNDVISVGNQNVFLYHENSFVGTEQVINTLKTKMLNYCDAKLIAIKVNDSLVSIKEAVASYLFNSQLLSKGDGSMLLIAPSECQEYPNVVKLLQEIVQDASNPIRETHFINLRESMRNGGGPACLRLRVVLTDKELAKMHQAVIFTDRLYSKLKDWITKNYRDRLLTSELADPYIFKESRQALDELTQILNLGSIYSFQR